MLTTPSGLPYPAPTDPIRDGYAVIQALAEGVEARDLRDYRAAPSSQLRAGRIYETRFGNTEEDAGLFALTNYTYGTSSAGSGAKTIIRPTTSANVSSILTLDRLRDVDVRIKYLRTNDGTYGNTRGVHPVARYCGASTYWVMANNWGNAIDGIGGALDTQAALRRTTGITGGYTGALNVAGDSNADIWRYARFRVWEDAYAIKVWLEGAAEPAWQAVGRFPTQAAPMLGLAGVRSQFSNFNIGELRVTELVAA